MHLGNYVRIILSCSRHFSQRWSVDQEPMMDESIAANKYMSYMRTLGPKAQQ